MASLARWQAALHVDAHQHETYTKMPIGPPSQLVLLAARMRSNRPEVLPRTAQFAPAGAAARNNPIQGENESVESVEPMASAKSTLGGDSRRSGPGGLGLGIGKSH